MDKIVQFHHIDFYSNQELQNRISALTNERNDYQTTTITTTERIKKIENAKQVKFLYEETYLISNLPSRVPKIDIRNQKMKSH